MKATYGSLLGKTSSDKLYSSSPSSTDLPTSRDLSDPDDTRHLLSNHQDSSNVLQLNQGSDSDVGVERSSSKKSRFRVTTAWIFGFCFAVVLLCFFVANEGRIMRPSQVKTKIASGTDDNGLLLKSKKKHPLSTLDPVRDLKVPDFPHDQKPSRVLSDQKGTPLPTNSWYQSLLMTDEPSNLNRAYASPFVFDMVGPVPGIRTHPNHITASSTVVQLNVVEQYGLTIGISTGDKSALKKSYRYKATHMTNLGVTLKWDVAPMSASIVHGMPFATMRYDDVGKLLSSRSGTKYLPTIASEVQLRQAPRIDRGGKMICGDSDNNSTSQSFLVNEELELVFAESDFGWLVFFSEPVRVQCTKLEGGKTLISVVELQANPAPIRPFYIRSALNDFCSTGQNPIYCHLREMIPSALHVGQGDYSEILRNNSHLLPGPNTMFDYDVNDDGQSARLRLDWDAVDMRPTSRRHHVNETKERLLMFALPHHLDALENVDSPAEDLYCAHSLVGPACLLQGEVWNLVESMPNISFNAPRPPAPWSLETIAASVTEDLEFRLPVFFQRGAGDTYFSGKMLAKLSRVLVIYDELVSLCQRIGDDPEAAVLDEAYSLTDYQQSCDNIDTFPTAASFDSALDALRASVEVWINGTAEIPFVYDSSWRGFVSCGCVFNGKKCKNAFPDCPAFSDPGLNFGNAYYNDQHFHYGYHIYAAAVVAKFDESWGRKMFERVLLLVRSVANPSTADDFFPTFRHKDWYQGSSWASGIISPPFLNGRNQESSSEAIAAYEAVALYGKTMAEIFQENDDENEFDRAKRVEAAGLVLTATELRSVKRYWHVQKQAGVYTYPSEYTASAVGMLWQTMAQLQTWFGSSPYLAYGIQLLPLTPISESRDDIDWIGSLYLPISRSCSADPNCITNGWSILELAVLAGIGHQNLAFERALSLPADVFESSGGNGHSRSNTLWFISTRVQLESPLPLHKKPVYSDNVTNLPEDYTLTDCYQPLGCTEYALDETVDKYTCRQRIQWLMKNFGLTQKAACFQVAALEFPSTCGLCDPSGSHQKAEIMLPQDTCKPCAKHECESELNRCPAYETTFVCSSGKNRGGCSSVPWNLDTGECDQCCELSSCSGDPVAIVQDPDTFDPANADCPLCTKEVSQSRDNLCPQDGSAPYLCYQGANRGGCSPLPWQTAICKRCCMLH